MNQQKINPDLHPAWLELMGSEFQKPYFKELKSFLVAEKAKYTVYPPGPKIFSALNATPPQDVKVVIIGQDPYHGPNQANGMCFSVEQGIAFPPSLRNIFKEIASDIGGDLPKHGDLTAWAQQGVLLLNATLTVRANQAGSHQNKGWEQFTDRIINELNINFTGLVFLLWGNFAKKKAMHIDLEKHHVLTAAHPSPLSAHNGFFGCKHFSMTNEILKKEGNSPIKWQL